MPTRNSSSRRSGARFPKTGISSVDADTSVSPKSWQAALTAIGARQCRRRRRVFRARRQRLRRVAAARPPRRKDDGDGLLPVQQRGDRGPPRPEGARRRARRHRRLGRPPRQRHAGHLLGRPHRALLLDPPDAALSRHRRAGRDRRRQHRQCAAQPPHRQRGVSRCLPVARSPGRERFRARPHHHLGRLRRASPRPAGRDQLPRTISTGRPAS